MSKLDLSLIINHAIGTAIGFWVIFTVLGIWDKGTRHYREWKYRKGCK